MVDFFDRDELADGPEVNLEFAREIMTGVVLTTARRGLSSKKIAG